jgi:hypothetical protein
MNSRFAIIAIRVLVGTFAGCIALIGVGYFGLIRGCTSSTPRPLPPKSATDVRFCEWTAWQSWRYTYRFDASPVVCQEFAVTLMKQQAFRTSGAVIKTNDFTKVPVIDRHVPAWFDVTSVTNGTLLTDRWSYAVVDRARGRLYYFNSH